MRQSRPIDEIDIQSPVAQPKVRHAQTPFCVARDAHGYLTLAGTPIASLRGVQTPQRAVVRGLAAWLAHAEIETRAAHARHHVSLAFRASLESEARRKFRDASGRFVSPQRKFWE